MRRRQVFAQRRRSALDPSGAAGSGPAATTPPPPVSREEEEARAQIWTPTTDVTAAAQVKQKRKTLRLKQDRDPWLQAKLDATADAKALLPKRGRNA
jgi:hypothetical protein